MESFANTLRKLVLLSAAIAWASLLTMVLVTCVDVVLRKLGHLFHPGKALLDP